MKKRLFALFVVAALLLTALAGCSGLPFGRNNGTSGNTSSNSSGRNNDSGDNAGNSGSGSGRSDADTGSGSGGNADSGNGTGSGTGSGSGGDAGGDTGSEKDNDKPSSSSGSGSGGADKFANPSDGYSAYAEVKSSSYDRLSAKIDEHPELVFSVGFALMPVVFIDLSMIPLTMLGTDSASFAAMSILGMENFDITRSGDTHTLTYTDSDGSVMMIVCRYDEASDSMSCTFSENGTNTMYFEYVRVGSGYASQYSSYEGDGSFSLIKMFCDDDRVGIGMDTVNVNPNSIYKDSSVGLDFVRTNESYFILDHDVLTIYSDGELETY